MIHASRDDESRLRWHLRAAELSEGETRATHLSAAYDIDPSDDTAEALETLLTQLDKVLTDDGVGEKDAE